MERDSLKAIMIRVTVKRLPYAEKQGYVNAVIEALTVEELRWVEMRVNAELHARANPPRIIQVG
ncbi:MAG: hypothetical protein Q8R28_13485 [Dehalococcoidia bacterium]|nr:hypothetical protein [Dehalococcoidia bacterium]